MTVDQGRQASGSNGGPYGSGGAGGTSPPVSRRTLIAGGIASVLAAGSALGDTVLRNESQAAARKPRTVFVSSSLGSDTWSGTRARPWATLGRVESALRSGALRRTDRALLRRGDTFFGSLAFPALRGSAGVFTLGAYGAGAKPVVSGYKVSRDKWRRHASGIWKLDLRPGSGHFGGNTGSASTDVAFLKVGRSIKGRKRWTIGAVANEWDFYSGGGFVYVRKATSPGAGVRVCVKQTGITPTSNTVVTNLDIVGHGAHGIAVVSMNNVLIRGNTIREIGGARLRPDTRYGNGVEIWIGSANVRAERNVVKDVYDVAFTLQGEAVGGRSGWRNVHITRNVSDRCNMSFELWSIGPRKKGTGFVNCSFTGNTCRNAGYSWGQAVRPDRAGKGTHLLLYRMDLPTDVEVTGNVFGRAYSNYAYIHDKTAPAGFSSHHNTISLRRGQKIVHQGPHTLETAKAYVRVTGAEVGTAFRRV
ncbi:right-handed parallel beta-helix repeat-containing protein [Arthrobacter halodurans]|uniref:Right-handed parallel beta-helix repeat-containing protein n=1 Tax=Arthrobacter halodurans TaxID=516699 RepID=A0ABV4UM14_9MICC